jgi:hypothetical protein
MVWVASELLHLGPQVNIYIYIYMERERERERERETTGGTPSGKA